jgi:hypothetical protein
VVIFLPYILLGMVKLRCRIDAPSYPCGWMSFHSGITWHAMPVALIIAACAAVVYRARLTYIVAPLAGGWAGLAWYAMPVRIIHPPAFGGHCPDIPILCHDMPLFGLGGLFYWLLPFALWTVLRLVRAVATSARQMRSLPSRQHSSKT